MDKGSSSVQQHLQQLHDLSLGASSDSSSLVNYKVLGGPGNVGTAAVIDTLCQLQIASFFNDPKLMLEARSMFNMALRFLRSIIDDSNPDQLKMGQLDDVAQAIHCLTPCAWYNCVQTDSLEWARHTRDLLEMLATSGWDSLNSTTVRSFYHHWKGISFFDGIVPKSQVSFSIPRGISSSQESATFLNECAIEVPGVLTRANKLLQARDRTRVVQAKVYQVLTELNRSIANLKKWHLAWVKSFPPRPLYKLVSIKNFGAFSSLVGWESNVFPLAYEFSEPRNERDFRILCICLFNLNQAIISVNRAFQEHCKGRQFEIQLKGAYEDAETCASDLCKIVPWATEPPRASFAAIHAQLPLTLAMRFYLSQDRQLELSWCNKVHQSLFGESSRETRLL